MDPFIQILLIVIFILAAGLFSIIEISIASFGKNKIEELRESGNDLVPAFEKIQKNLNAFFGTIQILTTLFIASAILITFHLFFNRFSQWLLQQKIAFLSANYSIIATIISLVLVTVLVLVFCILVPKSIGFKYSDSIGKYSVRLFLLLIKIFKYPVQAITWLGNLILKLFNEKTDFAQTRLSEDEIRVAISDGVISGAIDENEKEIFDNIFKFNDLKAREVMIPRTEIVAIEMINGESSITKGIINSGFSIVPVYQESLDNIVGVLHTKNYIRSVIERQPVELRSLVRRAYFVPETKPISEILREMQNRGERMAIVTDEYGGTEGLITMEDILEEIVGEIKNDKKTEEIEFSKLPDGSFSVLGSMEVSDFNKTFNICLPESSDYNTVSGFVADISGKILNRGESAIYKELKFELIKKIRQKMVQFKVYSLNAELILDLKTNENEE
jgi:magnesium and cobalt exporter, CNNM family